MFPVRGRAEWAIRARRPARRRCARPRCSARQAASRCGSTRRPWARARRSPRSTPRPRRPPLERRGARRGGVDGAALTGQHARGVGLLEQQRLRVARRPREGRRWGRAQPVAASTSATRQAIASSAARATCRGAGCRRRSRRSPPRAPGRHHGAARPASAGSTAHAAGVLDGRRGGRELRRVRQAEVPESQSTSAPAEHAAVEAVLHAPVDSPRHDRQQSELAAAGGCRPCARARKRPCRRWPSQAPARRSPPRRRLLVDHPRAQGQVGAPVRMAQA